MEIGILVKIYQAGLINESMFAKVIENVSKKRFCIHHSFFGIKDMKK